MKNLEIYESYPLINEQNLNEVERQLGIELPDDYRNFLLSHNGGSPKLNIFPIAGDIIGNRGMLNRFLCIQEGDDDDMRVYVQTYQDRVPLNLLPIAYDPGGNLICLSVDGLDKGKVYFWTHEEECEEGESPSYNNIYFVANSFNDLINSLTDLE